MIKEYSNFNFRYKSILSKFTQHQLQKSIFTFDSKVQNIILQLQSVQQIHVFILQQIYNLNLKRIKNLNKQTIISQSDYQITSKYLHIIQMGQRQALQPQQQVTLQQVQQGIHTIFDDKQIKFASSDISIPISRILQNLSDNIPAQKTELGFVLNLKMIKIFYHKGFLFSMGKLINLLMDKLQQMMKKSIMMIQKQQWMFCLNLSNFIIFFSDDKLIRMAQTVNIRNDLSQQTRVFIQKLEKQGNQFQATQNLIDKFSYTQIQRIQKCLRISMNQMIKMRTQILTRSQKTLKIIQKLQQACFILYLKALYSPQHTKSIVTKAKSSQFLKSNLNIGHYFLGKGSDLGISSIYQSAVLFLFNLTQKNKLNIKQYKSLPSHLFKTLPIISQNTLYDFIMNICLFSLTYIKQGTNQFLRLSCNRLMTLKLLDIVVKEVRISSPQITYYLEEICLQTKIGMIQRSFVTDLVQNYMNLVRETIDLNKKKQKQPISQSKLSASKVNPLPSALSQASNINKYSKQTHISQILAKYLQSGKQNYNVKYSNKKFKITTIDVITQLQNDQNQIQTEFRILCEKYIYQVILGKKIIYQYNDRQIWSQILPHILEDKELTGDDVDQNQLDMSRSNKNRMVRQVGNQKKQKSKPSNFTQSEERRIFQLRTQQHKKSQEDHIDPVNNVIMIIENLNISNDQIQNRLDGIEEEENEQRAGPIREPNIQQKNQQQNQQGQQQLESYQNNNQKQNGGEISP